VFDLISKRNWFFAFSLLITIPGLIFILLTPITGGQAGLKFSIDYTGGTEWTMRLADANVTADQVHEALVELGQPEATVTKTGRGFMEIRLAKLDLREPVPGASAGPSASPGASGAGASASPGASPESSPSAAPTPSASPGASPSASEAPIAGNNTEIPRTGPLGDIVKGLESRFGPIAEQASLSSIGAIVSSDLIQQAVVLIFVGALGILGWITLRFRDVKFGVTALVALLHDVIVVIGVFAILGTFAGVQIDGLFVTAMLTVIGFSVHDTIVVFDRIRENRARHAGEPFAEIVNHSLLQTFGRSITTSFTVVLTLTALLLFGGSATQEFVLALLIGIVSGTYSSIFNASPLLVVWTEWDEKRRRSREVPPRAARPASA
jgi:preprotein translocase subunit SecF